MQIYVSIDDTDNIESRGTGELAGMLAEVIDKNKWGQSSYVTRHQLLVHPDVPYTSHNSAMCFSANVDDAHLDALIAYAAKFLETESADGSDPGLCVVASGKHEQMAELIAFGQRAKRTVVSQREAYELARRLGIHLSAHGGTGDGIIGALAGAGLRMSGNDGRLRGGLKIHTKNGIAGVGEIRVHPAIDEVRSLDGRVLPDKEMVVLDKKIKTVLLDGKSVLLVMPALHNANSAFWQTCQKQQLMNY